MAEAQPTLPLDPPAAAVSPEPVAPAAEAVAAAAPAPSPEPAAAAAAPVELTSEKPSLLDFGKAEEKPAEPKVEPKAEPKVEAKPAEKPAEKPVEKAAEPAKEAPKVEAPKPAEAAKPAEPAKVEPPAEPIVYNFELPEVMKGTPLTDPVMKTFTESLNEFRAPPELGQKLLNLHAQAMQGLADQKLADQHRAFNQTRDGWRKEVLSDEQIGGSGHQTAMKAIARMRDMLVPEADRAGFEQFLRITGAGDHPQFLKLLHRAAKYFDEPGLPPENPGVPADIGKQNGARASALYDHPRSNRNRQ